jgi:porphobilinogen synthase
MGQRRKSSTSLRLTHNPRIFFVYVQIMNLGQFPQRRMRRLRRTGFLRNLVRESVLTPADFIYRSGG